MNKHQVQRFADGSQRLLLGLLLLGHLYPRQVPFLLQSSIAQLSQSAQRTAPVKREVQTGRIDVQPFEGKRRVWEDLSCMARSRRGQQAVAMMYISVQGSYIKLVRS
jgi:hypothetical protein